MDYRAEILALVNKVTDDHKLEYLYTFIKLMIEKLL